MATRDISAAIQNSLEDDVVYPFFAIEMLFDTAPIRLWTGYGTLVFEGTEYLGTGTLLDVSAIEETTEISARGATISLSGMNSEVISLALQSAYQGRVCNIHFGMFSRGSLLQENTFFGLGGGNVGIGTTTPGSKLSIVGLPTSSAGLSAGDIWNDGGTLKIV